MDGWLVGRGVFQRRRRFLPTAGRSACLLVLVAALLGLPGCGSGAGGDQGEDPLTLSLQVPSQVRLGEKVSLAMILKNPRDGPVEVGLQGLAENLCRDFVVSTAAGVELWRFVSPGAACPASQVHKTLGPGEELILEGEWAQTDAQGAAVAAGRYLVRGILYVRLDLGTPNERALTLQTDEEPLVIESQ